MIKACAILTLSILFCLSFIGCAPGLGSSLNLSEVDKVDFEPQKIFETEDQVKLNILKFSDSRKMEAIAQIDGRLIKPEGDLLMTAQRIFEQGMKSSGVQLSLFNSPSIRGTIKEWLVEVIPGFPVSKIEAEALIGIELLDLNGNVVYRSDYGGKFEQQNPFLSENSVQSALGSAMRYAVTEATRDARFTGQISGLSSRALFNPNESPAF